MKEKELADPGVDRRLLYRNEGKTSLTFKTNQ